MGAGDFPAGCGPAGFDPVAAPSAPPSSAPQPTALKFDVATRTLVINDDGTMASVHPVDQAVDLALGISVNSIASAIATGNTLRKIPRASGPTLQREAQDAVRLALSTLLTAKKIAVTACVVTTPTYGQLVVQVQYVNLITNKNRTTPISIL